MSTLKTLVNDSSVEEFINSVSDETKREDSFVLLELFTRVTGEPAKMWGTSIIGFGLYHYKSERSKQEGDWPLVGFSPRRQSLTLYLMTKSDSYLKLLQKLGKHKTTGGCLYINKMSDIDRSVLEKLVKISYDSMKKLYS